ncbi:cytosolic phospholipase A2 gamma [Pimephales promelas]|nr:cytosolic phospholipase A2 gamma [Pimephales promelas]
MDDGQSSSTTTDSRGLVHSVKIDEQPFTKYWNQESKDPFPIYTVIDKQCKQMKEGDPWCEFTPHKAGYSLIGAFVDGSSFGSHFENGSMIKKQPEIDS